MTVAEIVKEDQLLDSRFQQIMRFADFPNSKGSRISSKEELSWWLSNYPTLKDAEVELLKRQNKSKSLQRGDFSDFRQYVLEIAKLDRDIMMLESTVDELYKDWEPTGAKHEDFKIGTIFRSATGRWICTDVGKRTVVAIRYTPENPEDMDGPPYFLAETVFDEFDIEAVDILENQS